MAELAYAEVSKTSVLKTCGFDPRCSHHNATAVAIVLLWHFYTTAYMQILLLYEFFTGFR